MATKKKEEKKPPLSPQAEKAKQRSPNYEQLSGQEQWDEDKELGILDWDGT
jgi:hypothetical protein